jgi:hypothetical protein
MRPQASSTATIPSNALVKGPLAFSCLTTSWVAAGSVAVATPANNSARMIGAPIAMRPTLTSTAVRITTLKETQRMNRPWPLNSDRESFPPSRKATMVSATEARNSYHS